MSYPQPSIALHTLHSADGSATYTSPNSTHTLTAGINYPLEVPYRSDEDPESTYIEVSLRPHNGVSMVRERYIEDVVRRTLETVVLGEDTPRSMLQVTIQVQGMESDDSLPGGVKEGGQYDVQGVLDLVVGSVNAAVLGCLDGGVRMRGFVGAVLVGLLKNVSVQDGGRVLVSPNVRSRKECSSLHVFGFDSRGRCVLMESQGDFDVEGWERAEEVARLVVCGGASATTGEDVDMSLDGAEVGTHLLNAMRQAFEARALQGERWKA